MSDVSFIPITEDDLPDLLVAASELRKQMTARAGPVAILQAQNDLFGYGTPTGTPSVLLRIEAHPFLETIQLPQPTQEAVFVLWEKARVPELAQSITAQREAIAAIDQLAPPDQAFARFHVGGLVWLGIQFR